MGTAVTVDTLKTWTSDVEGWKTSRS